MSETEYNDSENGAKLLAFVGRRLVLELGDITQIYPMVYLLLDLNQVVESTDGFVFHFSYPYPFYDKFTGLDADDQPQYSTLKNPDIKTQILQVPREMGEDAKTPMKHTVTVIKELIMLAKPTGMIARLFFSPDRVAEMEKRMMGA
jgi:hypothetical protein